MYRDNLAAHAMIIELAFGLFQIALRLASLGTILRNALDLDDLKKEISFFPPQIVTERKSRSRVVHAAPADIIKLSVP